MEQTDLWWNYWYFHLPNYVLAALLYTMFGRFALGLFLPPDSPNYIFRWFCRLTDPVLAPVRVITPLSIGPRYLPLVAAFWLGALRLAFFAVLFHYGLTPAIGRLQQ